MEQLSHEETKSASLFLFPLTIRMNTVDIVPDDLRAAALEACRQIKYELNINNIAYYGSILQCPGTGEYISKD